jgi:hypothetical protein
MHRIRPWRNDAKPWRVRFGESLVRILTTGHCLLPGARPSRGTNESDEFALSHARNSLPDRDGMDRASVEYEKQYHDVEWTAPL